MFFSLDYISSALLSLVLLVDIFHQEFAIHKLGLGPNPNLRMEFKQRDKNSDLNWNCTEVYKLLCVKDREEDGSTCFLPLAVTLTTSSFFRS